MAALDVFIQQISKPKFFKTFKLMFIKTKAKNFIEVIDHFHFKEGEKTKQKQNNLANYLSYNIKF